VVQTQCHGGRGGAALATGDVAHGWRDDGIGGDVGVVGALALCTVDVAEARPEMLGSRCAQVHGVRWGERQVQEGGQDRGQYLVELSDGSIQYEVCRACTPRTEC